MPVGMGIAVRVARVRAMEEATAESPYSIAIKQMAAAAGGIYISLVALCSFLGIDVPKRVWFAGAQVDPIAVLALCLAVVQPLIPIGGTDRR